MDESKRMQIRVLLVDDHIVVRTGIRAMLEDDASIVIVGEVESGEDAVQFVRKESPNVVLMDANMPGIGGLEATRRISHSYPESRILVVTTLGKEPYPSTFLDNGATGYVTKGAPKDELLTAIKRVNRGDMYISADVAQAVLQKSLRKTDQSLFDVLSERENQIMLMIVKGEKVQDISDKLCLSAKTVNGYRYRIFDKLNIQNDVELTHLAYKHDIIDINEL
jgi:two-component system, NarL family, invasion response regulator UvrY